MNPVSPTFDDAATELRLAAASPGFDEETARAEVYGVLALVFQALPAPDFLAALRVAVTEAPTAGGFLEAPWADWVAQARQLTDDAVQLEYRRLFEGVGRADVAVFASHYLSGFLNEKPLAELRGELAALGLTRDASVGDTEDHIAYLCEVMRYLIAGDDAAVANLSRQQAFFSRYLQPWVGGLCDAVEAHPEARFFAAAARFLRAFMAVEAQGFDLLS